MTAPTTDLAELGRQLRAAGLTPRALAAWAGTAHVPALPSCAGLSRRPSTAAAAALELFVAGRAVAIPAQHGLAPLVEPLRALGLVERGDDGVRATVTILPLGEALLVCDRADAPNDQARVCWPDDSSYHLATALPAGRQPRWLDLCSGSAFAPLARPGLAAQVTGIDLNPRAVQFAALGAGLSGRTDVEVVHGDLGDAPSAPGGYDLVTCNMPIPDGGAGPIWRHTSEEAFARLWETCPRYVAPGGLVVMHAVLEALEAGLRDAAGERVIVAYTPAHEAGFGVAWWRPSAPAGFVLTRRSLTSARPHLDWTDGHPPRTEPRD